MRMLDRGKMEKLVTGVMIQLLHSFIVIRDSYMVEKIAIYRAA